MPLHPAAKHPDSPADQVAEDAQYYRRMLHTLIDAGDELVGLIRQQARTQAEAPARTDGKPAPDLTIPFERVARTIRRTIVLARHVAQPPSASPASPARHRIAARKRIIREVEDVIQRTSRDTEAESLRAELDERLDGPELDAEIDDRPVAEIIADICRDLGLAHVPGTHPWQRRTPADIAALCARAARPWATPPRQPLSARADASPTVLDGTAYFRGG